MKDQVSALVDEELSLEDSEYLYTAIRSSETLSDSWTTYHLIGDCMRGSPIFKADLTDRIMQQLEQEPVVLAPKAKKAVYKTPTLWSVAASVAAVMFVGWMVLQQQAQTPTQDLPMATAAQGNVSPESMNSYLLAHQELAPDSGMQTSYYVRPVTYAENGK